LLLLFANALQTSPVTVMSDDQRKLVSTKRVVGTILDWRGKFGWIQPAQPVDHPRYDGKIYLAEEDVQDELAGVGAPVTFFVYCDGNGLGAMNVRPSTEEAVIAAGGTPGVPAAPVAASPGKGGAKGASHAGGDRGDGYGDRGGGYGAPGGGGARGQKGGGEAKGAAYGQQQGGYSRGPHVRTGKALPHDEVLERVHTALNNAIWQATKPVMRLEKEWDQKELSKRVVKYLNKAAQPAELMTMPWHEAAQQFVENGMNGYSSACGEKPWFFELHLAPAFSAGFWEIASGSGQGVNWREVEQLLTGKYEELMDDQLLDKAIWDSAGVLLPDESIRNKLYKALKSCHEAAFKEAMNDPRRLRDLQRVEVFTRLWLEQSMGKAWQVLENNGMMSAEHVVRLFQDLLAPFGEDHPFSCVPAVLTQVIGRPPGDWPFLQEAAGQFFAASGAVPAPAKGQRRPFVAFGGGGSSKGYSEKGGYDAGKGVLKGGKSNGGDWKRQRTDGGKGGPAAHAVQSSFEEGSFTDAVEPAEFEADPVAQALMAEVAAEEAEALLGQA